MTGFSKQQQQKILLDQTSAVILPQLLFYYSKRYQRSRTLTVPVAAAKATVAPVVSVEVDTPTYLEVPDFQRVAIIGDYASGVLFSIQMFALKVQCVRRRRSSDVQSICILL